MPDADRVRAVFIEQAEACEGLGSSFTGSLCRIFAENLSHDTTIGGLCLDWPGDPHHSADSVPLRICGGLHALVLSGCDEALAATYPRHSNDAPDWPLIETALINHEDFLTDWMTSPPQTNEVSRSAVLWPAMMAISKKFDKPLRLLEVGGSAGLNLQLDRFAYTLGDQQCGAAASPLHLKPEWKGDHADLHDVKVASRAGCDLNPLSPSSDEDALRLRAYCWADQQDRKQRLDAALAIAKAHPVHLDRADAIEWLEDQLCDPSTDVCTVVYSTIAWQYIPTEARAKGEAIIRAAGIRADDQSPLCWLRFEADGETPGARIQLNAWPENSHTEFGRADFHGRWVDWKNPNQ